MPGISLTAPLRFRDGLGGVQRARRAILLFTHWAGKTKKGLTKTPGGHIIFVLVQTGWRDGRAVYGAGLENQ